MSANAIAVSRRLVEKGVDKQTADAVAEEFADFKEDVVDNRDDNFATKADLYAVKAELKADIARVETKSNLSIALILVVLAAVLADKF